MFKYKKDDATSFALGTTLSIEALTHKKEAAVRLYISPKQLHVRKAILFGSYAKGLATPTSDLDLVIDTDQKGLAFFAIADELEQVFHKKVDLFRLDQLEKGGTAEKEVVKTGLRIYVGR